MNSTRYRILQSLKDHILRDRRPPSLREIAGEAGVVVSVVHYHLESLEAEGYIQRIKRKHRAMFLTDKGWEMLRPIASKRQRDREQRE